jgi:hypothetical protein
MSEATKPVEEPVVAPTTTDTPAVTEPVPETKPAETVEEGTLGYKGPGLLK